MRPANQPTITDGGWGGPFEIRNLEALVHSKLETTDTAILLAADGCVPTHTNCIYRSALTN
jgi:hypothetical protein